MTRLFVDEALLSGATGALPAGWLSGFDLQPFAARALSVAPDLGAADALLLRTVTRLDAALLDRMPRLQAVATLSSGTDHLDLRALAERGGVLCTGHGGNAWAVADWVEWALARQWHPQPAGTQPERRAAFRGRTVLVVGVGAVGGAVAARLAALGVTVLACDPPRAQADPGFASLDLDEALALGPDAVTLHVPLERTGTHATWRLLDEPRLQRLAQAARAPVVLNAARGGVLDEAAARRLRLDGGLGGLALDTFATEPRPDPMVIAAADRVTPHIGGHSIEGKLRVAARAVASLRAWADLAGPLDELAAVAEVVAAVTDGEPLLAFARLDAADRALRACTAADQPFDAIRHRHRRLELPAP